MISLLLKLALGDSLTRPEVRAILSDMTQGRTGSALAGSYLLLLKRKGETAQEITAAARYFRRAGVRLHSRMANAVDACGTGGDGQGTLNASTLAAIVAAAGGVPVAKHGNRGASSPCGSSDLLEALGIRLDAPGYRVERALAKTGFTYCHAPLYQPALAHWAPLRRALAVRTLFNLLGPLLNPFRVKRQLLGTSSRALIPLMVHSLEALGTERALVVHSRDGLDEISVSADTWICELEQGRVRHSCVSPRDLGLRRYPLRDLRVSGRAEGVTVARALLAGRGPQAARAFVAANAGALFYVSGRERTLKSGTARALALLATGEPERLLARVRRIL